MKKFKETKGLQKFFYDGIDIRTVKIDGETNRNRAMQRLDEDEKGYTQLYTPREPQKL
jgi:hypothetical protein